MSQADRVPCIKVWICYPLVWYWYCPICVLFFSRRVFRSSQISRVAFESPVASAALQCSSSNSLSTQAPVSFPFARKSVWTSPNKI